jgi:hypothetical protein
MAGYRWDYDLHALAVDDPPAASPGYRDLARLELHEAGSGPEPPFTSCIADSGRVFFVDAGGDLLSFVQGEAGFEERGGAPDAGSPGASMALAATDRLAVVTPGPSVPYTYQGRRYGNSTSSVATYGVGPDGGLSLLSRLPESYFVSSPTLALHPSGSFLFACGIPSDGSPWGSVSSLQRYLLTFSIGSDGGMALFASLPVAGCGPMAVTALPS